MPAVDTRPQFKCFPSLRPNPNELGLVTAYDLGKPVNGQIIDLVGPYNGTLSGGPCVESTPMGMGMSFDGADDYANLYDGRISAATSGSMGFWVKIRTFGDGEAIFSYGGGAVANPGLFALHLRLSGGNYYFAVEQRSDGTAVVTIVRGSTILRANVWYYVELTSDGSAWVISVNGNPETLTVVAGANDGNWIGDTTATAPTRTRIGNVRYNGNDQDYFDGVIIAGTLSTVTRNDSYSRNEYLRGKSAMWRAGWGVGVSASDEGGVINDTLGKQSGETGIKFGDAVGRFRIVAEMVNGKLMKVVQCNTAGLLYIPTTYFGQNPTEAAFGTWEWWLYKGADGNSWEMMIIADQISAYNVAGQDGYLFQFSTAERMGVYRITNGVSAASLIVSNVAYAPIQTWIPMKVNRQTSGIFTMYDRENLSSSAGGGSNPSAADVTHTVAPYVVLDMDAGDKIGWSCPTGEQALKKLVIAK